MDELRFLSLMDEFRTALADCQRLYRSAGRTCQHVYPHWSDIEIHRFVEMMDDLHRGLLIKIYITIAEADRRLTANERQLATILFQHVWGQEVAQEDLRESILEVSQRSMKLKWYDLVKYFERMAPLRERVAELETIVMRVANIVAKSDGKPSAGEMAHVRQIETELKRHLHYIPLDEPGHHEEAEAQSSQAIQSVQETASKLRQEYQLDSVSDQHETVEAPSREQQIATAIEELDGLIGLKTIKDEVRTLVNYLRVQQQRVRAGLPETDVSLHMVFAGKPGTGKTTVARIVAKIYGAMGVLESGHLVETDRSGLVAEYAGQTGPKTNKRIDEALGGMLFVDEAYSLVASEGEDPYGREAVQTLLKRMEDDRDRLVVVLAGYPQEMSSLLESNPGLSSRFSRHLNFEDYEADALARIFGLMCAKNHYKLPPQARVKLMLGFQWLYAQRDHHFGNGRTARNIFEHAIRRLANRVAGVEELTREHLTVLLPDDIQFTASACGAVSGGQRGSGEMGVPDEVFDELANDQGRVRLGCPGCGHKATMPATYLTKHVRCRKCDERFLAEWGHPV